MPMLNSCAAGAISAKPKDLPGKFARPSTRAIVGAAAIVALCVIALCSGAHIQALDAAGAFDGKGKAIGGIQKFVDAIKGNLIWAMSVVAGLAVVLVGAMFMMGHTRAQDYAMKAGFGFLILAGGSGIVS